MFTHAVQEYFCDKEPKVYLSCAWDIVQHLMRCENFKDAAGLCEQLIEFVRLTKPKRYEEYQFTGILCLALLDKAECLKHISDVKSTREDLLQCIDLAKGFVDPEHVREIIYIEREVVQSDEAKLGEIWTAMTSKLRKHIKHCFDYDKLWENSLEAPSISLSETSELPRLIPDDNIYIDTVTTTSTSNMYNVVENNDGVYDMPLKTTMMVTGTRYGTEIPKDPIHGDDQTTASASRHEKTKALLSRQEHKEPKSSLSSQQHKKPTAPLKKQLDDDVPLYLMMEPTKTVKEAEYDGALAQDDIYGTDQRYQTIDD
uniref:Uncharacterized protein n=1 Tax=Ciona savignyi TaxID=51511 RepID=H2ZKW5_CIOSA